MPILANLWGLALAKAFYLNRENRSNLGFRVASLEPSVMFSLVLFILVAAAFIISALLKFAKGIDGLLSVSNVQVILWTGVILAGYLSLAILKGGFLDNIPTNLVLLMGISVGSTVAATGIRAIQEPKLQRRWSKVKTAPENTTDPDSGTETWQIETIDGQKFVPKGDVKIVTSGLLSSEKVQTELSVAKMQMIAWTLVSLGIFTWLTLSNIMNNNLVLPDVETGLLTLMGISHAGYNGNKIADKPPKQLPFQTKSQPTPPPKTT